MRLPLPLLFSATLAASLPAQPSLLAAVDRSKKPEPGPAPAISFPDYQDITLPNGLRIFAIQDDRRPSVTFRLLLKSGSAFDGEKSGLASMVATLLNRGTSRRNAAAFAKETDFLGSRVEAIAGSDSLSLSASALNKHTEALLDLMADAARNPSFEPDQLSKLQKQTLSALEAQKQDPAKLASKLVSKLVFGNHPYAASPTPESVSAISREDLISFHRTHFKPNNATLAIIGDVSLKEILPLLERFFGSWEKGEVPPAPTGAFPKLKGRSVHLVDRPGSVQSNIVVCKPGPARNTPDLPEIMVLNATLGGSASGRLYNNLREKHGWTYGAYCFFDLRRQGGSFEATAETRNEVTAPAIQEILKEITLMRNETVPDEELNLQRQFNVGNYLLSLENSGRTAQRVQDIDLYGLPGDFYRGYARRMGDVSSALLRSTAQSHLDAENALIVVVGEAKDIRKSLETLGPLTVYDTQLKPVP